MEKMTIKKCSWDLCTDEEEEPQSVGWATDCGFYWDHDVRGNCGEAMWMKHCPNCGDPIEWDTETIPSMKPFYRIMEISKTCEACPAQWEGRLDDGQYIYVRFRHGRLSIKVGGPTIAEAVMGETVFSWTSGGDLDGYMEYNYLKGLTRGRFEWPDHDR